MLPNFLIIGAARCATTWISENLSQHPDIFIPPLKELHFFDTHYEKGIAYYESYFDNRSEKAVGEATPAYLYFPNISSLIQQHLPNVKLIASIRNPVDRAFSHYLYLKAKAKIGDIDSDMISFEDKLKVTNRLIEEGFYYD
ncbi:MAG: heparan sulfate glucosamine 3-O-sulfotransferase, partial [Flavobacterium sp.]|nr:heparan sulfate glucosamine 3-O-sulfotransferase [Flavobacterium sp.]